MPEPFLDTNVLLRHFLGDDASQSPRATALLQRIEEGSANARISDIVVFETAFTLDRTYKQPKALVRDLVLPLVELPGILLPGKRKWREIFDHYVDTNLPLADAYHIVLMRDAGITEIITFDRDFDRVPTIQRVEP